jgi:CheY-like chemotaxis protein
MAETAKSGIVPAVLLVDDRQDNLLVLEGILKPLGVRLVKARSGEEALLALLRETFALILLDVQMPRLDGLQTAEIIKQREQSRHIPIIFITALSRETAYVFKGYAHGAVDYLVKPVDPEILRAKVQVFCDLFVRGEEIRQQALQSEEGRLPCRGGARAADAARGCEGAGAACAAPARPAARRGGDGGSDARHLAPDRSPHAAGGRSARRQPPRVRSAAAE